MHESLADWARDNEAVAEEVRRFKYEFGPLIEQAVAVQRSLQVDPVVQRLMAASADEVRIGSDGYLNSKGMELGARLVQRPALAALGASAGTLGCKGMGLVTANAEAAFIVGVQKGAEIVWLWPYKIGTFRTPNRIVGRKWDEKTIGLDIGVSATAMPFPLDLSFWFMAPEDSNHMVGLFLGAVIGVGFRVELFGWAPEPPTPPGVAEPRGYFDVNPFNFIFAFRIVLLEFGLHIGVGGAYQGHQYVGNGIDLSTFYITPSNLAAGKQYDGSGDSNPVVEGVITAPKRDGQPAKIFHTSGDTPSTLTLTFPKWLCTGMGTTPPPVAFKNDGGDGTTGWLPSNTPTITDMKYTFKWNGTDQQAWQSDIDFTIKAYSTDAPPAGGAAGCDLQGLTSVGTINIPIAAGAEVMTLSKWVFSAVGSYTLIVDKGVTAIENYPDTTLNAGLKVSTDDEAGDRNHFYHLPDPSDPSGFLTIDYLGSNSDYYGTKWYAGYQYEQYEGEGYATFCPIFWQVGKPFSGEYVEYGDSCWLEDQQKYTSTLLWSRGQASKATTLSITLTPNPTI
jgi:hypothetical protein